MKNKLLYGDNLDLLRNPKYVKDESFDLCYIDPPFNSKRRYNQIYNNVGYEDQAQAQAFIDIHTWDDHAIKCYDEIRTNSGNRYSEQTIELISGLHNVLKEGSLFAYLVCMTARIVEIHRVLKPTGCFYLHCDPTASHYLKLIVDSVFLPAGGNFLNEIIWKRTTAHSDAKQGRKAYGNITDTLLFYGKTDEITFHPQHQQYSDKYLKKYRQVDSAGRHYRLDNLTGPGGAAKGNPSYEVMGVTRYWRYSKVKMKQLIQEGRIIQTRPGSVPQFKRYLDEMPGNPIQNLWDDISPVNSQAHERIGWPTQKPVALLERIIRTSTNEGDLILDAYCGCGTTIAVAQRLNRRWIGMDITYQAISTILNRIEDECPELDVGLIIQDGMPRDMQSAKALAHKKDDRLRKEFEKWAILTYCNNKAVINEKKGADKGIDGITYIVSSPSETVKMVLQVKSGFVSRRDISALQGDMGDAPLAALITLNEPSKEMSSKAKSNGVYENKLTGDKSDRIRIVTIRDLVENKKRLELPQSMEALKLALRALESKQMSLDLKPPVAVVEPEARKGVGRALDVLASKSRASK